MQPNKLKRITKIQIKILQVDKVKMSSSRDRLQGHEPAREVSAAAASQQKFPSEAKNFI